MSSDGENTSPADNDGNEDHNSSEDEQQQVMLSLREKRRRYYEERKKANNKPASMRDLLENGTGTENGHKEAEKRFVNIRIYTRINKSQYISKGETSEEILLKGEVEIPDYISFEDLVTKAINLFNSQLKDKGLDIEFIKERSKSFSFRFAKRDGLPDIDFPWFDSSQKVSQSGVTSVWLMYEDECISYNHLDTSNNASTNAATILSAHDSKSDNSSVLKKKEGGIKKKGNTDVDRMSKSGGSCKCTIF